MTHKTSKDRPRGQMDVTHIPEFGRLKYVHVAIDTFSGCLYASARAGEATKHVIAHCLACFATLGIPSIIKTDNGSGYTSKAFRTFCSQFNIVCKMGIPYNPQGQGVVERAHSSLKNQLKKIKKGELYPLSPQNSLKHALFILNFLILDAHGRSAADRFWHPSTSQHYALVRWKDPLTGSWNGPDPVLIWGRGHVYVFPQDEDGPRCLPERLVRLASSSDRCDAHPVLTDLTSGN